MTTEQSLQSPPWMKRVLIAAGLYNLLWGMIAVVMPTQMLSWLGVSPLPTYPQFWQCIGMIVGVYGVGYLIASRDPYRHWPITLVGMLGKILGPIGFAFSIISGTLPVTLGWTLLTNDLIWWIPFSVILWEAVRQQQSVGSAYLMSEADDPLRDLRSNTGETLDALCDEKPQLVVFLRHSGCTFCREALSDLASQRTEIEESGCGITLVHLGEEHRDGSFFDQYGLGDIPRFADPECRLYRQFGLNLGGFSQLFGIRVWIRGMVAATFRGHGLGGLQGNGMQMPGVYVYHCGQILGGFQHARASDRPDYTQLAKSCAPIRDAE